MSRFVTNTMMLEREFWSQSTFFYSNPTIHQGCHSTGFLEFSAPLNSNYPGQMNPDSAWLKIPDLEKQQQVGKMDNNEQAGRSWGQGIGIFCCTHRLPMTILPKNAHILTFRWILLSPASLGPLRPFSCSWQTCCTLLFWDTNETSGICFH